MKKVMAAVFIMVLIPVGYSVAEMKQTVVPNKAKMLMSSEGHLSMPAMQAYYIFKERHEKQTDKADFLDCIEGQRRLIRYGMMNGENNETKSHQKHHSPFWVTIQCGK